MLARILRQKYDQIAAAISEWGWTSPNLITETGTIIAGHGRVQAAKKLGLPDVPLMVARGWTKQQIQAYGLADNKLALNAGWDEELLKLEIVELEEAAFDIDLIGFDAGEIAALNATSTVGLTDPDLIPSHRSNPFRVRAMFGCSAVIACCAATAPRLPTLGRCSDRSAQPDGHRSALRVSYDPKWRNERDLSHSKRTGKVENNERADWSEAWALFPGNIAYVWHAALQSPTSY
jgi:hypothetical protein